MSITADAILKVHEAHLVEPDLRIYGFIFNDSKDRFEDGTGVTTSRVVEMEGDIIYTQNSSYKIERVTPEEWRELILQDTD